MILMPSIIENDGRANKQFDLPSKLFEQNIITCFGEINNDMAYSIITQLLYLDSKESDIPISLYINSGGGSVHDGNAIIDVMRNMSKPVNTVCVGIAMSMGNQILAAGTGERRALPNSRIMIHSVASGTQGKIQDMAIDYHETQYLHDKLMEDMAKYTKGKTTYEEICKLTERDNYLSPEEAVEIGLIDKVIYPQNNL
jgi:ATP-dependent Clp protease protease subunit